MDRMTSISTFVKIAEAGGFSAAARKLGLSPSTVTMQIQELEDRLGVRLLNRSTRKVSLTEIGRAYFERCMHILADMDEADNAVQVMHSKPSGTFHLNVSVSIPYFLAPVITEFTSLYPDVKLSLKMSDRMVDLVEEGIDLAITTMPVPNSNLVMRRVGSFQLLVCGSPDYFARHGVPREPSDLLSHNCMKYTFSSWGGEWRFKSPDGVRAIPVNGNLEANSVNALRLGASLGQGLILMPDFLVRRDIKSGKLVPVLSEFCCPGMPINAVYPHRKHLSTNVRSFLDLVTKHVNEADQDRMTRETDLQPALLVAAEALPSAQLDTLVSEAEQPQA